MQNIEKIVLDYLPQSYQEAIHNDPHRFKVLSIGRRGGKTEAVLNHLVRESIRVPGLYHYISPSYRQSKSIAWVRLKEIFKPLIDIYKFNEQELYVENKLTGSRIELKGADNEDSLLGVGLNGVVMDESAMIKPNVWPRIVRPMLADSRGWAIFISTPRGKNWFYDLFLLQDKYPDEWRSWNYPTSVNKYIHPDELKAMKDDMPELLYSQEVLAQFLDDNTGVFKGIRQCTVGELKDPVEGRSYVMGVDLAKTYDFTVLTVMDCITRELVAFYRCQHISWHEQKLLIQDMAFKYNNALTLIDSTGVGDPIFEDLDRSNIAVEGYKFNESTKKQLIDNLMIAIEKRYITFPNIEVLIKELQSYEYVIGPTGKIKYSAPEGKHDDCVVSLGLAVWAIRDRLKEVNVLVDKGRRYNLATKVADYPYNPMTV